MVKYAMRMKKEKKQYHSSEKETILLIKIIPVVPTHPWLSSGVTHSS